MEDIEVVCSQHERQSSHLGIDAQEGSAFDPVLRPHRGANIEDFGLRTYMKSLPKSSLLQSLPVIQIPLIECSTSCGPPCHLLNSVDIDRMRRYIYTTSFNSLAQSCQAKRSLGRPHICRQPSHFHNALRRRSGEGSRILRVGEENWLC